MTNKNSQNKGFIAIVSLLIIATISMIVAISLLKEGVDNASLSIASIRYENAKTNTMACLEDTLLRIRLQNQFNRDLNYTLDTDQSCTTDITWYTPQQTGTGVQETLVDLTVTGTSQNFSRTFDYVLKVIRYDVNKLDGTVEYTNTINIISITEATS